MANEYDKITAFHYSAFRPSLHVKILKECLKNYDDFSLALDVGCGTGQSSIALTNFCNKVIGIEPSKEMLQKSIKHPKVEYSYYNKKYFDYSEDTFDIITFAGSLFYAKSQALLDEVIRVTKSTSKIVIYDFELLLDRILEKLNLKKTSKPILEYDHEINFDELNQKHIKIEEKSKNYVSLEISVSNLSHLLLSSKDNYVFLSQALGEENIYNKVTQKLHTTFNAENITVDAITYSTIYENIK